MEINLDEKQRSMLEGWHSLGYQYISKDGAGFTYVHRWITDKNYKDALIATVDIFPFLEKNRAADIQCLLRCGELKEW